MKEISIEAVLAAISAQAESGETFLLGFVKATGSDAGAIKTIARCRRGIPKGYERNDQKKSNKLPPKLHTERGTIPLVDADTEQYFTPFISHIIRYNNYKVRH